MPANWSMKIKRERNRFEDIYSAVVLMVLSL